MPEIPRPKTDITNAHRVAETGALVGAIVAGEIAAQEIIASDGIPVGAAIFAGGCAAAWAVLRTAR